MTTESRPSRKDAIRGCLIGGAIGDALGYPIEFMYEQQIFDTCTKNGIENYILNRAAQKAVFSDDTQMTLFIANGLLNAYVQNGFKPTKAQIREGELEASLDWLATQEGCGEHDTRSMSNFPDGTWLIRLQPLHERRAPGMTCLSALDQRQEQWLERKKARTPDMQERDFAGFTAKDHSKCDQAVDYIADPLNTSKGCGGIMRAAPVGLLTGMPIEELDLEAAQMAAMTHSHTLGYMPAAVLCDLVHQIVYQRTEETALKEIVLNTKEHMKQLFADTKHFKYLIELIDWAVEFSENDRPDLENIHALGEGWVGEESMAIAIYCALRYQDDFSRAMTVSVSHNGDSDSTGAVTGNILGAWIGCDAIETRWKKDLELTNVILQIADDLDQLSLCIDNGLQPDMSWSDKYKGIR